MPSLIDTLRGRDLGFLNMTAGLWGIELDAPDAATALPRLADGILNHPFHAEVIAALPAGAQSALRWLLHGERSEGRQSWAVFTRRFGEVRPFGPGKREKERPDLHPISAAETLWYRALIGRAILPGGSPPQEYAYIPDDLLPILEPLRKADNQHEARELPVPGHSSLTAEITHVVPASDIVLDHATTLLAALRAGISVEQAGVPAAVDVNFLLALLKAADLLDGGGLPLVSPTKAFLEAPRGRALAQLASAWVQSTQINELRLLPGLRFEGDWQNDPRAARRSVLDWLTQVPESAGWWNMSSFVQAIREHNPDFQRPAGDYDSWFIRSAATGEYLRGFDSWDAVDGALLCYLLTGPLHWLGILDLAGARPGHANSGFLAFRLSPWAEDLLHGGSPTGLADETGKIKVVSAGRVAISRLTPRAVRYQVARFCLWESATADEYHYRIAPAGLERAAAQGLKPGQLLSLLRRHTEPNALPPAVVQSLERWQASGAQARLEQAILLRLSDPAALAALKKSRAARYILEEISPSVIILRPGSEEKVRDALVELGYLANDV